MFMRFMRYDFFCSGCELSTPAMFVKLRNNKFLLFKEQTGDWLTEEKNLSSSSCSLAQLLCGTRHQSLSDLFENSSLSHSWETIAEAKKKINPRTHSLWTTATNSCCAGLFSPSNNTHPLLCRPAPQRETDRLSCSGRTWLWIAEGHDRVQTSEKEITSEASSASRSPDEPFVPPGASQILHLSVSGQACWNPLFLF